MALSNDLIMQFVKATRDDSNAKKESTAYGTIVDKGGIKYVQLDGAETPTPISSTTNVVVGERVTVLIKDHTAIVTGNLSSPSTTSKDLENALDEITELEIAVAYRITTEDLIATNAIIEDLKAKTADITNVEAVMAEIETLESMYANLTFVQAEEVEALTAEIENIRSIFGSFVDISAENMSAINADLDNLIAYNAEFTYVSADVLKAIKAEVDSMDVKYANIDFSNIGQAAMEYFYARSGLIENVTINNGTITGNLVGVTIKGDIIEGNTVIADKLVIQGEDGLYYKLNTDGVTVEEEQTEYNSLNGRVILAKSVTAEKVNVDDLVAFDATIGGFNITDNSIYSEVKDGEGNTTRGIYMDTDGQVNFGDADKFIKYYRDEEGSYHLSISADTVLYSIDGIQKSIADLGVIGEYVQISTYEGEPCVELGESDSEFKLIITNTRIMFMEGTGVPAYVNNQSLFIKKAVIEEELQQGGFLWKSRSNRNLGVVWKGVTS